MVPPSPSSPIGVFLSLPMNASSPCSQSCYISVWECVLMRLTYFCPGWHQLSCTSRLFNEPHGNPIWTSFALHDPFCKSKSDLQPVVHSLHPDSLTVRRSVECFTSNGAAACLGSGQTIISDGQLRQGGSHLEFFKSLTYVPANRTHRSWSAFQVL